ncbi:MULTISPECIES: bacillithiol system redox-active protein YtxJ [unclassified Sphingobacterium]|uniref:bacillithiol system redox-active protein YtxJ n=1 Tax=Sphingobacterium TaxID=28453 RepID=UPI001CBCB1F8|nr:MULTISPECIES: bacillithiol system redox-active protein YtxJ [unclassified Sphingobacterium]MCS4228403.1 bacillithiol system protein YtxJ [Sphingobacterium sp. BIGb0165]
MINWIELNTEEQLQELYQSDKVSAIFKHSTTCGISNMAKRSLERMSNTVDQDYSIYLLDLLRYRALSNEIAQRWNIEHQSPQILIVEGKNSLYDASHGDIQFDEIEKYL